MHKRYLKFITSSADLAELNIIILINETFKDLKKEIVYSDVEKRFYVYDEGYWQQAGKDMAISIFWTTYSNTIFPRLITAKMDTIKKIGSEQDAKKRKKLESQIKRFDFFIQLTQKKTKEYIESLSMSCMRIPDTKYDKIPLKNGYIDISNNFSFSPVTPYIYNRYTLDFKVLKTKKEPAYFLRFLKQILPDADDREFLINWLAYMLVIGNYRQKALFLYGSGRNGKGVLSKIIYNLLGEQNCSTLTVQQLSSDKYFLGQMNNKLLNISPDSDDKDKIDIGAFKTLTGNDNITVRDIYGAPFNMIYQGKMIFSINKVPYFSSKDLAVMERVEILNFPVTIAEKDRIPNLENIILEKEGDLIFNFLLERVKELKKIDFKFKAPMSVKAFTNEIMDEQDNISSFIVDHINDHDFETKWEIGLSVFYNEYKDYCADGGFKILNRTNFKESVLKWTIRRSDIKINYGKNGKNYVFTFQKQTTKVPLIIEGANGEVLETKNIVAPVQQTEIEKERELWDQPY